MKNVFVGNMNFQTTEAELRALFEPFGQVARVHIAMDRETGRARGFAFVEMPNDAEAARAIGMTRRVTVAATSYLEARGIPSTPAELAHHDCVIYTRLATGQRWYFDSSNGPVRVDVAGLPVDQVMADHETPLCIVRFAPSIQTRTLSAKTARENSAAITANRSVISLSGAGR